MCGEESPLPCNSVISKNYETFFYSCDCLSLSTLLSVHSPPSIKFHWFFQLLQFVRISSTFEHWKMKLSPREVDKLGLHNVGYLAQKRLARGLRLNHPEAVALIATQVNYSLCLQFAFSHFSLKYFIMIYWIQKDTEIVSFFSSYGGYLTCMSFFFSFYRSWNLLVMVIRQWHN